MTRFLVDYSMTKQFVMSFQFLGNVSNYEIKKNFFLRVRTAQRIRAEARRGVFSTHEELKNLLDLCCWIRNAVLLESSKELFVIDIGDQTSVRFVDGEKEIRKTNLTLVAVNFDGVQKIVREMFGRVTNRSEMKN